MDRVYTDTRFDGVGFLKYILKEELARWDIILSKKDMEDIIVDDMSNMIELEDLFSPTMNTSIIKVKLSFYGYNRVVLGTIYFKTITDIKNAYKYNFIEGDLTFKLSEDDVRVKTIHYNYDQIKDAYLKYTIEKNDKNDFIETLKKCFADNLNRLLGYADNSIEVVLLRGKTIDDEPRYIALILNKDLVTDPSVIIHDENNLEFNINFDSLEVIPGEEPKRKFKRNRFELTRNELIEKYGVKEDEEV